MRRGMRVWIAPAPGVGLGISSRIRMVLTRRSAIKSAEGDTAEQLLRPDRRRAVSRRNIGDEQFGAGEAKDCQLVRQPPGAAGRPRARRARRDQPGAAPHRAHHLPRHRGGDALEHVHSRAERQLPAAARRAGDRHRRRRDAGERHAAGRARARDRLPGSTTPSSRSSTRGAAQHATLSSSSWQCTTRAWNRGCVRSSRISYTGKFTPRASASASARRPSPPPPRRGRRRSTRGTPSAVGADFTTAKSAVEGEEAAGDDLLLRDEPHIRDPPFRRRRRAPRIMVTRTPKSSGWPAWTGGLDGDLRSYRCGFRFLKRRERRPAGADEAARGGRHILAKRRRDRHRVGVEEVHATSVGARASSAAASAPEPLAKSSTRARGGAGSARQSAAVMTSRPPPAKRPGSEPTPTPPSRRGT